MIRNPSHQKDRQAKNLRVNLRVEDPFPMNLTADPAAYQEEAHQ
eukprot:IDg17262t1